MQEDTNIYWHDAFYDAIQLEFHDFADALVFEDRHQLSKEALEIDVLVVKKAPGVAIDKNIGKIFKGHNIFEYKSETDNLSTWDYNKVTGYAMLYSAFEKVREDDITISYVITPKPKKLFSHLESKGLKVTESHPGIYRVEGDIFPVQIIETKNLTATENIFLKNLRSNLTQDDMLELFEAHKKYGRAEHISTYFNRVFDANKSILEEVLAMSKETQEILFRHFVKIGMPDKFRAEGRAEGKAEGKAEGEAKGEAKGRAESKAEAAKEMLKDGFTPEKISRYVKMPVEWVEGLKEGA
jgi:hypothetical protein